jgi:hypothetical protein
MLCVSKLSFVRFIWNFYRSHEAQHHVASYEYKNTELRDVTILKLLSESLCVQEYPHLEDPERKRKSPFEGLVVHTLTAGDIHNGLIGVIIRSPSRDPKEAKAERAVLKSFEENFQFVYDFLHTNDALDQGKLKDAATTLASWVAGNLREDEEESAAAEGEMF